MQASKNIQTHQDLLDAGLKPGDRIHLGVVGNHVTEDAHYLERLFAKNDEVEEVILDRKTGMGEIARRCTGIRCRIGKREIDLDWGDIVELWKVEFPKGDDGPLTAA